MIFKTLSIKLLAIALVVSSNTYSKPKSSKMLIKEGQVAPKFSTNDVSGKTINLADFKGKKVLLSFYRNVGCPVCNFRFHELEQQSDFFKSKGLVVISIYESSQSNMKGYLLGDSTFAMMVPNATLELYQLYAVERSMGKVMKGVFNGAMGKMNKGKKLFKQKMSQDGNMDRIGADFLIDESGNVEIAYYGKYLGDHLPVDTIRKSLKDQ